MEEASFAESRVMYYHIYVADKCDILKHHIRSFRVDEMDFDEEGHLVSGEKAVEYTFDQKGNILSSVIYDDAYLPADKQDRGIFYVRDVYHYNRYGDPIEHRQYNIGERHADLLEDYSYEYDPDGHMISAEVIDFADPSHSIVEYYRLDAMGRVIEEYSNNGFKASFHYDDHGRLDEQMISHDQRDVVSRFYYNEKGQLVEFRKEGMDIGELEEVWFRREFDDNDRVTAFESLRKDGERSTTHFYYLNDRLIRRETIDEKGELINEEEIEYDDNGLIVAIFTRNEEGQVVEEERIHYNFYQAA